MESAIPCPALVALLAPVAALLVGFFLIRPRKPEWTHWPMLVSSALVAGAALYLAAKVAGGTGWDATLCSWFPIEGVRVDFGLRIDNVSAYVLAMVAVVSGLIHCYAVGYMHDDPGFSRFFLYFHFFFFSMVGLLLANNYLQMYLFWEGVGLSSFLLIGFWYDRASARAAAWKAFLMNRIGDVGFMLALFLMFSRFGTARFEEIFGVKAAAIPASATTLSLLLFWAASAKSAQFPLYGWLPDAMEGPTPVSALMHAATMVAAGVFLMARSWPILHEAPSVLKLIAWVGAFTSLSAAVLAGTRKDLKRILAYSTVSQLGLMMLAVGVGEITGALFHLISHGFFKALLFLCAGNVIHGLPGHRSTVGVDDAGGLMPKMPWTYAAFLAGAMCLSGFLPFVGAFSKDMILAGVFETHAPGLAIMVCLITIGSGFYIFRMLFLTFHGERPEQKGNVEHAHEAGAWTLAPVLLLALSILGLSVIGPRVHAFEWSLALRATALGLGGAGLAWWVSMGMPSWDWHWRAEHPELEQSFNADLGWQQITTWPARLVAAFASALSYVWDARIWDPFTEATADSCVGFGEGLSALSRGVVNEYLWWMLAGAAIVAYFIVLCS